jgi:hypothetical protein
LAFGSSILATELIILRIYIESGNFQFQRPGRCSFEGDLIMKSVIIKPFIILTITTILLVSCAQATPTPIPTPTEVSLMEISTAVPPTATPTVTPEPTATEMPTSTEIPPTQIITVESVTQTTMDAVTTAPPASTDKPQITPKSNTNCRKFPTVDSTPLGYFLLGQRFSVYGRDVTSTWFLIPNPSEEGGKMCWVWSGSTEVSGDVSTVPVVSGARQ